MKAPRLAAVAAVVLLAAAGCTGSASPTPAPTGATAGSPSAPPSPTDTANDAEAALQDGVREYYRTVDGVYQDPNDAPPLKDVTSGTELTSLEREVAQWAKDGWRQTGDTEIREIVIQSLSANNEPASAQVDVCYDVSDVDLIDANGTSQVDPNRPDRAWERLQMEDSDGWRVTFRDTLEQEPCAGS